MARRKRSLVSWAILLVVLGLAAFGGYTLYNSPTGQSAERVVKKAVKAGVDQTKVESGSK
jgi:hypothetical protein